MPRPCLICTAPFDVIHFNVEACRACAEFFKRTVMSGRTYICRQGDRKCTITRSDSGKFMCRSCRYDKCVEIGMEYALPRRKLKRKKDGAVEENAAENPSTSVSPNTSETVQTPLLDRIGESLKEYYSRKLEKEYEYVAQQKLPRMPDHEELYVGNFNTFSDCFRLAVKESTVILKAFEEFESFPIDIRVTIYKNYASKFGFIECVYFTAKHFDQPTHQMLSLITCVEFAKLDQWIIEEKSTVKKNAIQSTVKGFGQDYSNLMGPMMKVEKLSEREFYALSGLCYCDVEALQLPDEIIKTAEITRAQIYEELQDYYQNELKLSDYSKRIGDLMTFIHGAREAELLTNEAIRTYATMYGLNAEDRLFREFFSD
ncbi:hypothetical protein PMAYCL1PPCAC_16943 [Pristionchus mayeri]|uniref:Nuclear receptor n=1 Tax=Pristionchus mayeri TaxID=1317129 RepID=A0AAN5CLT8_9BILA|nr:hypothetical protein PMAYCL1PPCAC_16943 [Pristionchus mayeri]